MREGKDTLLFLNKKYQLKIDSFKALDSVKALIHINSYLYFYKVLVRNTKSVCSSLLISVSRHLN